MENTSNRYNSLPIISNPATIKLSLEDRLGIKIPISELSHSNTKKPVIQTSSLRDKRAQQLDAYLGSRSAGIDKADAFLHQAVNIEEVKRRAEELGLPYFYERIGKHQNTHALRIGDRDNYHVYLELYRIDSPYSRKLLTNPRHFPSIVEYSNFIVHLFGLSQFECLTPYRLDFYVDLDMSFEELKKMLRIKYKQINRHNSNRGYNLNYLLFGGSHEKIAIYDKSDQLRNKSIEPERDITRIEIRLTSKALPVTGISQLTSLASYGRHGRLFEPFNRVSLEPVTLADINNIKNRKDLIKLVKLQTLMDAEGFDYARRFLNQNGNFRRDYLGLITFSESPFDLNEIFLNELFSFMRKTRHQLL